MRTISSDKIRDSVSDLCLQANLFLRKDVLQALKLAYQVEPGARAKKILKAIIDNARIAAREKLAICQDTGLAVVFVEVGNGVKIAGDLKSAVNRGIELGYRRGYLRNSIIRDPLSRRGPGFSPAVIHTDMVKGSKVKLTVLPKGFGCENKFQLRMFKPTAQIAEIKKFVIEAVKAAGADACPPYVVGVGMGGTADYAALLAKKALLRSIAVSNRQAGVRKLEKELLKEINALDIGPMGLGGKATALGLNIETYPTHIAGLPVAVNLSCHALRSATKTL